MIRVAEEVTEGLRKDDSYTVPVTSRSLFRNPSATLSATLIIRNISILRKKVAEKPKKNKVFVEDSPSFFNPCRNDYSNHRKGQYLFKKKSCRCLQ
jgi:hypothetical protein